MHSRPGERNGGKPDRKEDATPCIELCLRLLMRSAQAMSFSLFPFPPPRLPIKPFLLIPQCTSSDLQSKFKSALKSTSQNLPSNDYLCSSHSLAPISRANYFTKKQSLYYLRCRRTDMNGHLAISSFIPTQISGERFYCCIMRNAICTS